MISEGDIFIVLKSADGESVAVPVGTKQGVEGDKFFPVRTADGFKVPCAVDGKPSTGESFIPLNSADGERIAVPLGGGGGVDTSLTNYYGFSNNANITFNDTTLELESSSFTTTSDDLGGMVFWDGVDENGFSTKIANAGNVICFAEKFKSISLEFTDTASTPFIDRSVLYSIQPILSPIDTINEVLGTLPSPVYIYTITKGNTRSNDPADTIYLEANFDGAGLMQYTEEELPIYGIVITAVPSGEIGVTVENYNVTFFDDIVSPTYPRVIA